MGVCKGWGKIIQALKARIIIAHGEALGNDFQES